MEFWILNRCVNPWVRWLLQSPVHPLLSGTLLLIVYRGRRSGRSRALPVQYSEQGDELLVLVGSPEKKRWWRNLRPNAPVRILHQGAWFDALASVLQGDMDSLAPRLEHYFERFPSAARFLGIARDHEGELDRAALARVAGRAVMVVIATKE